MRTEINRYQDPYQTESQGMDAKEREDYILKYTPLVKYVADRLSVRLPSHVSRDDLCGSGVIGLLDAVDKFDSGMGVKFRTYAEHRIRGAMLDELRKMDWVPRSVRKETHRIEAAIASARVELGREPEDFEVADEMDIDIDAYHKMIGRTRGAGLLSLDVVNMDRSDGTPGGRGSDGFSPLDQLKIKELKKVVAEMLSTLPEKEQLVMSLYYYDELTLKEIAEVLSLTESRISQIHAKVILRLRTRLKSYYEG